MDFEKEYHLDNKIGAGAYSLVYEVFSLRDPTKRFAAKIMNKE